MKIRRFGRTEFKISQLTFGGGWVGGILIDPDKEIMHKALSLASKKGINWIDTAESYSEGKSEKNIGELLSSFSNDTFHISTKARLDWSFINLSLFSPCGILRICSKYFIFSSHITL